MPAKGNEGDLRFARQQHELAWRLLALDDRSALRRLATAAGVARSTMSDYLGGRRWLTPHALVAIALYLTRRSEGITPQRRR